MSVGSSAPDRLERRDLWVVVVLILGSFAVYGANLDDYFIGDDFDLISSFYDKPASYFVKLLWYNESGDVWKDWGIDPAQGRGFLRPLKIWLLKLDWALWGTWSPGFHFTATLFFAATIVWVYLLARLLLPASRYVALLAAWLALIHPVFSEVVPFLTAREEVILWSFALGAIYAFLRYRRGSISFWPSVALYALALLTKESGVILVVLFLAYDLTHGHVSLRRPWRIAPLVRVYGTFALLLVSYFALRYAAFGNFKGGDTYPTGYTSIATYVRYHRTLFRSMFDPTTFSLAHVDWIAPLCLTLAAVALLLVLLRAPRLAPGRVRLLLFLGPGWYLGSTLILYGTHFAWRRNTLPILGLILFGVALCETLGRGTRFRPSALAVLPPALLAALFWLPPTLENSLEFSRASHAVKTVRATIEQATADLPDGANVLTIHVPQWEVPPYYFGWALQSALGRPFTESDVSNRLRLIDEEDRRMNRRTEPLPESWDRVVSFERDQFITEYDRRRWVGRLIREGVLRPTDRNFDKVLLLQAAPLKP